jgi:2-polyprenyl-3-methyl-5-hydroxy-6-metoxy-1,4-benzoquinol methylase
LKKEWFDEAVFWQKFAPVMFDGACFAEVSEVADGVTRLSRLNLYGDHPASAPKLLDLCCGFGRMSLELSRRGFAVTGVDITEMYLDAAKNSAEKEKLDIELVKEDARVFKRADFFDVAVNLYISFGYFEKIEDDALMVKNVFESLKRGGAFIIETLGKEVAVRDFVEREWFPKGDFTVLTEYAALDSWERLQNRWIMMKDGKIFERTFCQRLYSAFELKTLLMNTGFSSVAVYGGWNDEPYDQNAKKLIVSARK